VSLALAFGDPDRRLRIAGGHLVVIRWNRLGDTVVHPSGLEGDYHLGVGRRSRPVAFGMAMAYSCRTSHRRATCAAVLPYRSPISASSSSSTTAP
jgi:hypothetical protein